ncbi:hypothetical protein SK128_021930, partial [Halocaridina rubra]
MASNTYHYSEEEIRFIKFFSMIRKAAIKPLYFLLSIETEGRGEKESLFDFFKRKDRKISKIVKGQEKENLSNTTDVSSLDITFLYKCLQYGTEKLADRDKSTLWKAGNSNIESIITKLKDLINEVLHEFKKYTENEFLDETDKLKKLLENILNQIGTNYSIDVHQKVQDMKMELNNYRDKAVEDKELAKYRYNRQCEIMKTKGKDDIKKIIRKIKEGTVNPVNHVVDMSIDVKDVFLEMKINSSCNLEKDILCEDILQDIKGEGNNPSIVIIGCAGAGITTIVRKILYEFESGVFTVKGLESYDIVLHHECRNMSTDSLKCLLEERMPSIVKEFKDDEIRQTALHLKTMVILDGIDELNNSSAKLFDEVINLKKTRELSIIITTRPEKLPYLESYLKSEDCEKITLLGIPHERRAAFVKKFYIKLAKKEDLKNKPIDQLFNYLEKYEFILDSILRLPYNLVLIIILYCHTDLTLDEITTAPVLYRENYLLYRTKLAERLRVYESTKSREESNTEWVIDIFLCELAKVSLIGLLNDQINISSEAYQRLKTVCNECSIPVEQMASAFLTPKYTGSSGILYSFPHKGIQEYFAARYIWMQLTGRYESSAYHNLCPQISFSLMSLSVSPALSVKIMQAVRKELKRQHPTSNSSKEGNNTVKDILKEVQKESSLQSQAQNLNESIPKHDITKLQNMFMCLLGIIQSEGIAVPNMVKLEILQLLQETGVRERSHWLDILSSVKCDSFVAEFISKQKEILEGEYCEIDDFTLRPYVSLLKTLNVLPRESQSVPISLRMREASTNIKILVEEIYRLKICVSNILMTDSNIADYMSSQHNIKEILSPSHEVKLSLHKEHANLREVLCMVNNLELNITKFQVMDLYKNFITTNPTYYHKLIKIVNRCKVRGYVGPFLEGMHLQDEYKYLCVSVSSCRDYNSLKQQLQKQKYRYPT